ncbi:hypothetical protein Y032_0029g1838 [Ancylostoma ceylanicum]|uniref:Uncharacterized protein n=1 Tax=Ancylostoma ceylanicum TaxID=53326 RepID=A0A016UTB5_9BILA|nr:hypothetical protein Y032_0029g1838 [Ancylostoma ceylanicum]
MLQEQRAQHNNKIWEVILGPLRLNDTFGFSLHCDYCFSLLWMVEDPQLLLSFLFSHGEVIKEVLCVVLSLCIAELYGKKVERPLS